MIEQATTAYHHACDQRPRIRQELDSAALPLPDVRYQWYIKELLDLEQQIDGLFSELRILALLYSLETAASTEKNKPVL